MNALVALLLLAAQAPPSEEARAAAAGAVEALDGWVGEVAKVEEKLRGIRERAGKLQATQDLLTAAIQSRDAGKLRDAIAAWSPSTAGKLNTVAEIELELRRLNPSFGPGGSSVDEALLHFGARARDLNARDLRSHRSSGLAWRIERALEETGSLRRALEAGRRIKQTWDGSKDLPDKYDEVLRDLQDRFDPAARDAVAELLAIHRLLQEPGLEALPALEARLWDQVRRMNLLRPIDAPKDPVAAELRRSFPEDGGLPLTEIRTPEFLTGRLFHVRDDRYYLFTGDGALHRLTGSLETIRRVVRMMHLAKIPVDPGKLALELPEFQSRFKEAAEDFGPLAEACRAPRAVVEPYLVVQFAGDSAAVRKAVEDVTRFQGRAFEETMAYAIFDEADRGLLRSRGTILLSNVIVEVAVTGDGFDGAKASLWVRTGNGALTALHRGGQGIFSALVPVDPAREESIFIGGTHGGDAIRETMERLPRLPARMNATLRFALRPKDSSPASAPAFGPADVDPFARVNAAGPKAPPPAAPPWSAAEKEEMKVRAAIDTDPGSPPDETAAKFGTRPTDLGDGGFAGLLAKLIDGDRAGAEAIYQRITGCAAERARKEVDKLLGEDKTRKENEDKGKSARVPYAGPKPGPDGDFLKAADVSPADVAVPVDPAVLPDVPRPDDLRPPPEPPAEANPFERYRRMASAWPSEFHRRQQTAVEGERRSAAAAIRDLAVGTRGGMDNFDAGAARSVVLTVWQPGTEDGDIVRISVGGKVVAAALTVTNSPQSFTIDLTEPLTAITVVALNEGSSPGNTAVIKVSAGGRELRASSWNLKSNGVASSVIRRGGGP